MDADTNDFLRKLGSQIANARKRKRLTQARVAEMIDVEPETISRFERGMAAPSLQRLVAIAEILEVGVHRLMMQASPLTCDRLALLSAELEMVEAEDRDLILGIASTMARRLAKA